MLLRLFKGTGPGVIFLITVALIAVWIGAFLRLQGHFSMYFDLDPMPLYGLVSALIGTNPIIGLFFTLFIVGLMGFLVVNLNTNLFFINERTFLPALFYILLSGFFPQYQVMNPAVFGAVFLMLSVRRIMDSYRIQGTAYNLFDAAIFISTGSLFYAHLIWFAVLVFIGIVLLRTVNLKEIFITIIGLITPYAMTFGIYYVLGKDTGELLATIGYNLFSIPDSYVFTPLTTIALIIAGLSTFISLVYLFSVINAKKIKSRQTFFLLTGCLIISLGVYLFVPAVSVEIAWIAAIPVSYFLTHYLVFARKKLISELVFGMFLIIILLIQILNLK